MKKNKGHLPFYGVGPPLCCFMAVMTAVAVILSEKHKISGQIENNILNIIFSVIGFILIAESIAVLIGADMGGTLHKSIVTNTLKTNGSYRFVRNPRYSFFFICSTGVLFLACNAFLLALPPVHWGVMTVTLINTEEKWLVETYGQEYTEYCRKVNRCIPWFPKK